MIGAVFVLALLGAPKSVTDAVVGWFASAFTGAVLTFLSGTLVEQLTGDILKKILLPIRIGDLEFSVSLFVIVTAIVKLLVFH